MGRGVVHADVAETLDRTVDAHRPLTKRWVRTEILPRPQGD